MTLCVQATPKVQHQQPEAKMIEDETRMATYVLYSYRPSGQASNKIIMWMVVVDASGILKGHG